MSDNISGISGWKKILILVLIVADLALLVVGIITIPPHFSKTRAVYPSADSSSSVLPVEDETERIVKPKQSMSADTAKTEESINLSTDERPDLEDFLWYTESVFYEGVPANVVAIENLEALTDNWKALIIYDPENTHDSSAMEFLNVNISGKEENVSMTLDWYLIFWSNEGESFDETEMEDSIFNGKWEDGDLWASGAGTIRLTDFYGMNGKQYAIGTMDTPDGIPAYIALVRP